MRAPLAAATQASVAKRPRGRLFPWHPALDGKRVAERSFDVSSRESTVRGTLLWGVSGVDVTDVSLMRNSSFVGTLAPLEAFEWDQPRTQAHIAHACEQLRRKPWVRRDAERSLSEGGGRVQCLLDDFATWLATNRSASAAPSPYGNAFPVATADDPTGALSAFIASSGAIWQPWVALSGGRIHNVAVTFDLAVRASATRREAQQLQLAVGGLVAELDDAAPDTAGPALKSADGLWVWEAAQSYISVWGLRGSMRAAGWAAITLAFVSGAPPLAVLATVAVAGATLSLLALFVACGWALGSTEALLAHVTPALMTPPAALVLRAYASSESNGRASRAKHAFERGGAPVISGCVAIMLAIAPMLGSQLMKEFKVAVALVFTAVSVAFWIGFFLPALLGQCGPQATEAGMPLYGSTPWLVLKLFVPDATQHAPIGRRMPGTVAWLRARKRRRDEAAYAAYLHAKSEEGTVTDAAPAIERPVSMRRRPSMTHFELSAAAAAAAAKLRAEDPRTFQGDASFLGGKRRAPVRQAGLASGAARGLGMGLGRSPQKGRDASPTPSAGSSFGRRMSFSRNPLGNRRLCAPPTTARTPRHHAPPRASRAHACAPGGGRARGWPIVWLHPCAPAAASRRLPYD